jgi:uncharacterized protein (UPF0332 family)
MNEYAADLWQRANQALTSALNLHNEGDQDAAASRAYYAAFYAVSALFATEGRDFRKHSAVEAAVFRDLVRTNRWSPDLGNQYRSLHLLRDTGDYGGLEHVTGEQAKEAVRAAQRILDAVRQACPELGAQHGK